MQQRDQLNVYGARPFVWVLGVLATMTLAACGSSDEPKVAAPVPVTRAKVAEDPTAKMARAVPIGAASAPVNLKYEILSKPIVGKPVDIQLAAMPTKHADSMAITFVGSAGLTLSTDAAPTTGVVKDGDIERVTFSAQAQQEAVYYVTVTATLTTAGSTEVRTFTVPLIMSMSASPAAENTGPATAPDKPKKT